MVDPTDDPTPIGTRIADRYRIEAVLGEGAVARTYLALDETTGRRVAAKLLYPSRSATANDFERFEREAAALASLEHAGIPRYIDHFVAEDRTFCLVQEYVEGRSLDTMLREGSWRERAALIDLAASLLRIVAHLAEREPPVVHRDIKPANLLVTPSGGIRLVDFGGVREAVRETIRAGSTVIGTYGFMPPEQLIGRAVPASDLFAVGITLVSLWTGRGAEDLSSDGFTVDLDVLGLPPEDPLRRFIAGLVEVHLDDRYAHARDALADCEGLRSGRAPQFADRLARQAHARRALERAQARRRLLAGRWTLLTFAYTAMGAAFFGLLAVVLRALSTLATGGGLAPSLAISAFALLTALVLLALRYRRDEWEPPDASWDESIGEVRRTAFEDAQGNVVQGWGVVFPRGDGEGQVRLLPSRLDEAWGGLREGHRLRVRSRAGGTRGFEVDAVPLDIADERVPIRRLP